MKSILLGTLVILMSITAKGGPRDAQWKAVDEAVSKGLPRSAITSIEPIIQGALKDKAWAEATRAIARRIAFEGQIEGNKPEEQITRLEAEIVKAPAAMIPMLDTILAHWYWEYFQMNRWRFMRRTATAQAPGKDLTTWDLPRLFAEIDRQYQKALAAGIILKATPVTAWDDLLTKGTMPDADRPTLFDFVAHEALEFYSSGEQAGARPEDAFELMADGPVFGTVEEFLAWKVREEEKSGGPGGRAQPSPVLRALWLYQDLLRFHQKDPAPAAALAAADLDRLEWAHNTAVGEEKNSRYKAALDRFIREHVDFEISALAMARKAEVLQGETDLLAAHQTAKRGASVFPNSPGGKLCQNLIARIEGKEVSIGTERVWNCFPGSKAGPGPCPEITIDYRNLTQVYFRAINYPWEVFLEKQHRRPEDLSEAERREVLAKAPALEWSESMPATADFKKRTFKANAPTKLAPGFYFIVAGTDPKFSEKQNVVAMTSVWVSDLALVLRQREGAADGFVLEAGSGEPIPEAAVDVWTLNSNGERVAGTPTRTDKNGFFAVAATGGNKNGVLRARVGDRQLASADTFWISQERGEKQRPFGTTVLFTDRALYRPGQSVQYKGICLWVDQDKDNYEVLKGENVEVIFRDVNGKEISRQKQRANAYGSFTGIFTAPRDRLMGQMSIAVEGRANGMTPVRVEEYKRPKYEVTLDAPKTAAKLNEKVTLTGRATAYTGAAVDGAEVKFRVVRQVRMPWWWGYWRGGGFSGESQEIAHGSLRSQTDGTFNVEFLARPDLRVAATNEPTFEYQVHADVTDAAGETRSGDRTIRIGYTALEAKIEADRWQVAEKPIALKVRTDTLDGEPQVAEGSLKVYSLQAPARVERPGLAPMRRAYWDADSGEATEGKDQSDPNQWPLGAVMAESGFTTDTNGAAKASFKLPVGAYRVIVATQDRFGKKVTGQLPLMVLDPAANKLAIKVPQIVEAPKWETQPGTEFMALWGTGYDEGRAFVEIEHRGKVLSSYWTTAGRTQQEIKLPVTEAMRGGFTLHVTQVRENRALVTSKPVQVPWRDREMTIRWEHFTSKLQPGQKETWTAVVTAADGAEKAVAEMVATLYDESLDAFAALSWPGQFGIFRYDYSRMGFTFGNRWEGLQQVYGGWEQRQLPVEITYRNLPPEIKGGYRGFGARGRMARGEVLYSVAVGRDMAGAAVPAPAMEAAPMKPGAPVTRAAKGSFTKSFTGEVPPGEGPAGAPPEPAKPDLSKISARKNLNETAFFFPQLVSDSNGVVRMAFSMPEALTRWRFFGFAHDARVRSGLLQDHAVTAKDLMVQPNPPRFLREGDTVEFTVKVSNQSDKPQKGSARLNFNLALTGAEADRLLGLKPDQEFNVPPKESRTLSWRVSVPDGCGFLTYKVVAAAAAVSDGEEGAVPVLSRRVLVAESLPLPIRGPAEKKFEFKRLAEAGKSSTLRNQALVVEMTSNPAWYAVLALPYLMEYPYECSEQVFNRLYANSLARTIATRDPKIHRVFEQWRNTAALQSPLEKNQDLKNVALEETPWVRDAQSETEARYHVGVLFDDNRLNYETSRALDKLREMQLDDGSWPWFPGGRGNDYITLYIATGFGRLRHLGVDIDVSAAVRSLVRLDAFMTERHQNILKLKDPDQYVPSTIDALYLYGRSFFLKDTPVAAGNQKALQFFLQQARRLWLKTGNRQTQAHLALALDRFARAAQASDPTPAAIIASLRERSVASEEMGMYWRDTELSWWWYHAPIETQALMIEVFDEVARDNAAVENCKVWLLKQKQTRNWKTTKATADAVYALLLRGTDLLSSEALVQVKLGGVDITPAAGKPGVEAGTGRYEYRFAPADIKPALGRITVKKVDQGVAWGAVHWQYLEDMTKVTPYAGTPLKLAKSLFVKTATSRGPVLEAVKGALRVGDEVVVRIELRTDRDMEYVHLKDQRGSGTEPVEVLSQYRYQDGLAYYASTRDTASHYFIDYLPKGTYVFEYSTRVQLKGDYQSGMAEIQCMYAPEFNSHSESFRMQVR